MCSFVFGLVNPSTHRIDHLILFRDPDLPLGQIYSLSIRMMQLMLSGENCIIGMT